jgi:hypothetical protein
MHSESQRTLFRSLRSQGWSVGRIATHLNIPKSTLYGWDYDDREVTAVLKPLRPMAGPPPWWRTAKQPQFEADPKTWLHLVAPSCT